MNYVIAIKSNGRPQYLRGFILGCLPEFTARNCPEDAAVFKKRRDAEAAFRRLNDPDARIERRESGMTKKPTRPL
jgi:hypothetical protein